MLKSIPWDVWIAVALATVDIVVETFGDELS
jgi:hypothetical protein